MTFDRSSYHTLGMHCHLGSNLTPFIQKIQNLSILRYDCSAER